MEMCLKSFGFFPNALLTFTSLFERTLSAFTEEKFKKWPEPCQEVHFRLKCKNRKPIQCCHTTPIQWCLRESPNPQEVNQPQLDWDIDILMGCSHHVIQSTIWASGIQQLLIGVLTKGGIHISQGCAERPEHLPYKVDLITSVKIILWKQWDDLCTGNDTRWVLNRSWGRTWTPTHLLTRTSCKFDPRVHSDICNGQSLATTKWKQKPCSYHCMSCHAMTQKL